MIKNNIFSLQRLCKLICNDLHLYKKPIAIVMATLIVFSLISPLEITYGFFGYFSILYIGGFIITSFAFSDLHDRLKAHLFLTLPCSNLERFLSKWILTSFGYAIGLLIFYYLLSLLNAGINLILYQQHMPLVNIMQYHLWLGIYKYIILQSIVFLGAITFKRFVLIKTALTIGCLMLALSFFSVMMNAVVLFPYYDQFQIVLHTGNNIGYFIFWFLLAPFCLSIAYLRLTEYELI